MISVDQVYESSITKDGILTLASTWINDTTIERFAHKRRYGIVETCPINYSEQTVDLIDPGFPNPKLHISGEYIDGLIGKGYKPDVNMYSPAGLDAHEVVTMADVGRSLDVKRGDKIYFDPIITEPENYLGPFGKRHLYKLGPSDIICIVRDKKIIMQGKWCLLEPVAETMEDITTKSGILIKPSPGKKFLQGRMKHFNKIDGLKKNDLVLHMPGLNWSFEVEGKEYYAIEKEYLIAKLAA